MSQLLRHTLDILNSWYILLYLTLYIKISSRLFAELNVKGKTAHLLEENVGIGKYV